MWPDHYFTPTSQPDIILTFLVVGEEGIRINNASKVWYGVYLKPNAMEWMKRTVSRSHYWGLKKDGRDNISGIWKARVRFHNRTKNPFTAEPRRRYGGDEFDAVVIVYDPRSPRKTFELVWTKVCPGLVLRHECSRRIGH
jgi:hypothetical protein